MPTKSHDSTKKKPARGAIPLPEADLFGNQLAEGAVPLQLAWEVVEPDPNQARWVLPPELRARFIAGKLSAVDALRQWHKQVEQLRARLGKDGWRPGEMAEVRKLDEIEALARSLQAGGQVNPITVVRRGDKWRIETGERRFWAHVYLVGLKNDKTAAQIPVSVRPRIDPFRQAVENLHASPLNAIGLAREVARLLLVVTGNPSPGTDAGRVMDLATYRDLARQRVPPGGWSKIEEAMGRKADHLGRYLRLLLLPEEAVQLADRHDLTEKQLRPVSELGDAKKQLQVARLIAELGLSSAEVEWLCKQPNLSAAERELRTRLAGKAAEKAKKSPRARFAPEQVLYNRCIGFVRFAESVRRGGAEPAQALAEQFLAQSGETALAELRGLISFLEGTVVEIERARPAGADGRAEGRHPSPGTD